MRNLGLAKIFYEIADLLEMKGVEFKPRAYEKAARVLESLEKDVAEIYQAGGVKSLEGISGVGKSIAIAIEEFIKTGKIKSYQKLKKESPVDLVALTSVEGLGARKIKILYRELNIKNLKDLEKAVRAGKVRGLDGFGEKSEKNILQGIAFLKKSRGRFLLGSALSLATEIIEDLKELKEVDEIGVAGSLRRMKETIGDIDILVVSKNPSKVMDFFVGRSDVARVWAKGPTKSSVRLKDGLDCDLRVVKKESFGSAMQYFTGSKDHNIITRRLAIGRNLKLNEYGVFRGQERIAGKNEKEVYRAIGLPYIEPELRENTGEIEAATLSAKNKLLGLPKIIGYNDILGDFHCHTKWSDGSNTIKEMAETAQKMGYRYLAITDHVGQLKIAGAMDRKALLAQMKEIDEINKNSKFQFAIRQSAERSGFRILKGCEVNIKKDGSLDMPNEILSKLDLVLAGVHSNFKMDKRDMTQRLIRAMENHCVNIIVHPTGRVIFRREAYQFDFDEIFKVAVKTKTALEISAATERLDLKDTDIRRAIEAGVKLTISTDAHDKSSLYRMELGIAQARRGWAQKKDILNAQEEVIFSKSI